MKYCCQIYRSINKDTLPYLRGYWGIKLPLFSMTPEAELYTIGCDMIMFQLEDRHSDNLITVFPPSKLTEDQFNTINEKWNYCIENDLTRLTFEL